MSEDESKKIEILLKHWMEHNHDHAGEFKEWAEKAKDIGKAAVHDEIMKAVHQINEANKSLQRALEKL